MRAYRAGALQHFLYGLPALALMVPTLPAQALVPTFYAQEMGLGLTATGTAIFAARSIDVLADPLVGQVSDRAGRRKPFIAVGAVLAAVALMAVFAPPAGVGAIYLCLSCALLYVAWSLVMVPYMAWGAELTVDYAERTRVASWREGFGLVGIAIAACLPALLQRGGQSPSDSMAAIALLAIALGMPALLLLLRFVPEGCRRPAARTICWREGWTVIGRNPTFRRLLAAWFINGVANSLPAVLFPLFITLALGANAWQMGVVLLAYFAAALLSLPIWLRLQRWVDKHQLWCGAMALAIAAFLAVPLLPVGAILAFASICVVAGFALGADLALPPALQADVVDLDRLQQGGERAGLIFALSGMSAKLAAAIAAGIAFPMLDLLGLDLSASPPVSGAPIMALAVIYAWVPCVLKLMAMLVMWRYPLDRNAHADIARTLAM